ncbi:MAG: hypothetical protein RIQ59_2124 [Bacteroidota bacterium]
MKTKEKNRFTIELEMENNQQPFFSICIPTYNSVFFLKKLLDSLIIQSFIDFEIVISDDSTTDEVMNYCKEIEDARVIYLKHQSIHSATENWNFAIQKATGKYRMLVHHDDYFSDHKILEQIVEFHNKNGEKDAIFLGFVNENKSEKFYYGKFSIQRILKQPDKLLFVNYLSAPSCLIIHETVTIDYNDKLKWLVDVDFYQRLMINYKNIAYVPHLKMVIGGGEERITNTISNKLILSEFLYLRKKNYYKKSYAIFLIKLMKLKIILFEFIKYKLNGNTK